MQHNLQHWGDYRILAMMASAVAPTDAMIAFLALWTGSLWVKSTLCVWWTWNALFVSELILLLLYLSIKALHATACDIHRAAKTLVVLTLAGMVNIPIIYSSHYWQSGLHSGMQSMVMAMLLMILSFWAYPFAMVLIRVRMHHAGT